MKTVTPGKFESKMLFVLWTAFVVVLIAAWTSTLNLQQTVISNNKAVHSDSEALIEVEKIRSLADSQLDNSRAFFLLGSQSLFEKQKSQRAEVLTALENFEKNYNLQEDAPHLQSIRDQVQKGQEFFEQGMDFREKKTESRIVGQFFNSKMSQLKSEVNKSFDEIAKLHRADIERSRAESVEAAQAVETRIPQSMFLVTVAMVLIFLVLSFLILRLLKKQRLQLAQRDRLYVEATKAVQDRDEALSAISHDLRDSLELISRTGDRLCTSPDQLDFVETGSLVKSTVTAIEGLIQDIRDRKSIEVEGRLTLRLNQLPIDQALEKARLLMGPLASEHGVRLQVDQVNPPLMAFYDQDRILRVLSNLLSNSIKNSPRGEKVVVKVRSDQKFVKVSVSDQGSGIPSQRLERIFDDFWQSNENAGQGAGIGLAIVKSVVEAHGGTVEIQSQSGRGTTVTFSLPRRRPVGANISRPQQLAIHQG